MPLSSLNFAYFSLIVFASPVPTIEPKRIYILMLLIEVEQPVLLFRLLPIFLGKLKLLAQDALRDPQLC